MKTRWHLTLIWLLGASFLHAQENRFNAELDKFCNLAIKDSGSIPAQRKQILQGVAHELSSKRFVVFTCNTNSRRTLMLQVWAQTAFYYYGLFGKYAFSIGDTITDVYPGVAGVLTEAGFTCSYLKSAEPNGYVIAINKDYPINILSSKNEVGTVDTTRGVVVNICMEAEEQGVNANLSHYHLPFQSPTVYEQTTREREKYRELNKQIAVEMLYLGQAIKLALLERENLPLPIPSKN